MVGKAPEGGLITSSLFSLVPRQVMLESSAVAAELAGKATKKRMKAEEQNEKVSVPAARAALVRAIAAFLEISGFTRTLAALRSEAHLEIKDGPNAPGLDLEDMLCKYLELSGCSNDHVLESISGPEGQVAQRGSPKKENGIKDQSDEPSSKKKKKKAKGGDGDVKTESDKSAYENGKALPNQQAEELLGENVPDTDHGTGGNQLRECHMESKGKKGKKSKKGPSQPIETFGNEQLETLVEETSKEVASLPHNSSGLLDVSNDRSKDKKKKKNKLTSDLEDGVVDKVVVKESQEEKGKCKELDSEGDSQVPNATNENLLGEDNSKSKDKKKRKHKLTDVRSSGDCTELQNGIKSEAGKKEKSTSHGIEEDAKESAAKIENISSLENSGNVDKKTKKKKKKSASEETEVHLDSDAAGQVSKQGKPEDLIEQDIEETKRLDDSLLKRDLRAHRRKRKREKSEEDSEKSTKTPVNKQFQATKAATESPASSEQNEQKKQQQSNGNLGKNEVEGDRSLKSSKVELKRSAEPKTVNAFKRVKIDEVKFADSRLQDNSYWAKAGAETGYGAKAQEVLGQVKGRDFRHEKTKKKRGSYRGGQIDFQSHSVKFKYSDDEEEWLRK